MTNYNSDVCICGTVTITAAILTHHLDPLKNLWI